jgi:hypothetical protein
MLIALVCKVIKNVGENDKVKQVLNRLTKQEGLSKAVKNI